MDGDGFTTIFQTPKSTTLNNVVYFSIILLDIFFYQLIHIKTN